MADINEQMAVTANMKLLTDKQQLPFKPKI